MLEAVAWRQGAGGGRGDGLTRPRLREGRAPGVARGARPNMTPEDNRERIRSYLRTAGLESLVGREEHWERAVRDLIDAMSEEFAISEPASLYTYLVPMLTDEGP